MHSGPIKLLAGHTGSVIMSTVLSLSLAACGGGGGSSGGTGAVATTGSAGATASTAVAASLLNLSLVDGGGTAITTLSGGQVGVVRAKFLDSKGAAIPNAVVKFTASDATLIQFTPSSGSALTDTDGIATLNLRPADFSAAGALTITGVAALDTRSATGTVNIGIGAAPLVVGALSFTPAAPAILPAFSTLTLNVPVSSNGQAVSTAPGLTLSSLCAGDGAATLVAGGIANGAVSVTYTNKGCTRGNDVITAAIGNSSQSISLSVGSANIGTIGFVGSDLTGTSLVLKGTGGAGRKEAALLTFKVVDQSGAGLAGVTVTFAPTTSTGGLKVSPAQATTDGNGNVATNVQSGTIPTPVRVLAQATRNGSTISGISDALTVSTGLPIQKAMSMSVDQYNIEGLEYDGMPAKITVRMADQYGNPVSDNTTVNFVSEGGAVGSSLQGACQTLDGNCTVPLRSQNFRPANGRVTVLAYAQGIEDFVDLNGDGQYSCTNFISGDGTSAPVYRPLIDTCISGGEPFTDQGDAFLDAGLLPVQTSTGVSSAGGLDGHYDPANGDLAFPFNKAAYSAAGDGHWGLNYIRTSMEVIFSGSHAYLTRQFCSAAGCRDWDPTTDGSPANVVNGLVGSGCKAQPLAFRLYDVNNNPLPYGTTLTSNDSKVGTFFPASVPSANSVGGTFHQVTLQPGDCTAGSVSVAVKTPKGIGTVFSFSLN